MSRPISRSNPTSCPSINRSNTSLSINQSTNQSINHLNTHYSDLDNQSISFHGQSMRPSSHSSRIRKSYLMSPSLHSPSPSHYMRPSSASLNNQSISQSINQSVSGYASPSYPRAQSINHAISNVPAAVAPLPKLQHRSQSSYDQSINRLNDQSINRSNDQPINRSISQSVTRSYAQSPPQSNPVFSILPSTSPIPKRSSTDLDADSRQQMKMALQTLNKRSSFNAKNADPIIISTVRESKHQPYNDSRSQSINQSARSSVIRSRPQPIPQSTSVSHSNKVMTPTSALSPYHSQRQSLTHGISYQTNHPAHSQYHHPDYSPSTQSPHLRYANGVDPAHVLNYQSSSRSHDFASMSQRIKAIALVSGSPHQSPSVSASREDSVERSHVENEITSNHARFSDHNVDSPSIRYSSTRVADPSMVTMSTGRFVSQSIKHSSPIVIPRHESSHLSGFAHVNVQSPAFSATRPSAHSLSHLSNLSPRSDSTTSNLTSRSHAHSPAQIRSLSHSRSVSRRSSLHSIDHVPSSSPTTSEAEFWSDNTSDSEAYDQPTTNRYKTKPVTPIYTGRPALSFNVEPATSQTPSASGIDLELSPITPLPISIAPRSLTQSINKIVKTPFQILTSHQQSHRQAHSSTAPIKQSVRHSGSNIDRYSPVGLMNLGNTCFFNSALQCLLAIPDIFDYFIDDSYHQDLNPRSRCQSAVALSFGKLVDQIAASQPSSKHSSIHQTLNLSPISPTQILKSFTRAHASFAGYGQHDSQEAVRCLLDSLHEDLNHVVNPPAYVGLEESAGEIGWWQNYLDRNDSVFSHLFTGQLHSSLECQSCHRKSNAWDPFWDLQLPIVRPEQPNTAIKKKSKLRQFLTPSLSSPSLASLDRSPSPDRSPGTPLSSGPLNLYDCFQLFLSVDMLTDNEQIYCSKCKTHCDFSKKFSITRWPPLLTLHLKRFAYHAMSGNRKKIDAPVDFAQELDLTHLLPSHLSHQSLIYDLVSVSCHSGSTAGGHYTAMVRMQDRWFLCNDSRVYEIQGDQMRGHSSAYLLFYQKRE